MLNLEQYEEKYNVILEKYKELEKQKVSFFGGELLTAEIIDVVYKKDNQVTLIIPNVWLYEDGIGDAETLNEIYKLIWDNNFNCFIHSYTRISGTHKRCVRNSGRIEIIVNNFRRPDIVRLLNIQFLSIDKYILISGNLLYTDNPTDWNKSEYKNCKLESIMFNFTSIDLAKNYEKQFEKLQEKYADLIYKLKEKQLLYILENNETI